MPDSNIFVPMPDDQVGRMALIEAIRANTDAVNRLGRHSEGQDRKLDTIKDSLSSIDTRLTLLERDTLHREVEEHDLRLKVLEGESQQRKGARGFADAVLKYGPFLIALITALFIVLVASGRIVL